MYEDDYDHDEFAEETPKTIPTSLSQAVAETVKAWEALAGDLPKQIEELAARKAELEKEVDRLCGLAQEARRSADKARNEASDAEWKKREALRKLDEDPVSYEAISMVLGFMDGTRPLALTSHGTVVSAMSEMQSDFERRDRHMRMLQVICDDSTRGKPRLSLIRSGYRDGSGGNYPIAFYATREEADAAALRMAMGRIAELVAESKTEPADKWAGNLASESIRFRKEFPAHIDTLPPECAVAEAYCKFASRQSKLETMINSAKHHAEAVANMSRAVSLDDSDERAYWDAVAAGAVSAPSTEKLDAYQAAMERAKEIVGSGLLVAGVKP